MARNREIAIPQGQEERWAAFIRANPKVAKALELFRVSQAQYERALGMLYGPRLTTANSTSPKPPQDRADVA